MQQGGSPVAQGHGANVAAFSYVPLLTTHCSRLTTHDSLRTAQPSPLLSSSRPAPTSNSSSLVWSTATGKGSAAVTSNPRVATAPATNLLLTGPSRKSSLPLSLPPSLSYLLPGLPPLSPFSHLLPGLPPLSLPSLTSSQVCHPSLYPPRSATATSSLRICCWITRRDRRSLTSASRLCTAPSTTATCCTPPAAHPTTSHPRSSRTRGK